MIILFGGLKFVLEWPIMVFCHALQLRYKLYPINEGYISTDSP